MEDLINKKEIISDTEKEWKISFNKEKLFWQQIIISNLVYISTNCPYCKIKQYELLKRKKMI